jgi:outer membrane protein OmpA-like peptidoglycan-associated protein
LGEVYEHMPGRLTEASMLYKQSYNKHPFPAVKQKMKVIDIELAKQPMTAKQITKALSFRGFEVTPSVTLNRILFNYNSDEMTPDGLTQADELGKALTDRVFDGKTFRLVGHTDKQGPDEYNQTLSEKRAVTVKGYLVDRFAMDSARLSTEGRGERELLYPGDDEQDHALNRRVVVMIE